MVRRIIKYFFLVSAHSVEFIILNLGEETFPLQFQKLTYSLLEKLHLCHVPLPSQPPKTFPGSAKMGTALKPTPGWESSGVQPREDGDTLVRAWVSLLLCAMTLVELLQCRGQRWPHVPFCAWRISPNMNAWAELRPCRTRDLFVPHHSSPAVTQASPHLCSLFFPIPFISQLLLYLNKS